MSDRKPLVTVLASDCEWSYTKGTGAGGQKRNKTSSAVHCFHRPSGAHGYSETSRSQAENKADAFAKMAQTNEFQQWVRLESLKKVGAVAEVEAVVEKQLSNVVVEGKVDGKWTKIP